MQAVDLFTQAVKASYPDNVKIKGSYALILKLNVDTQISIGKKGCFDFSAGYYAYVGSAFGSGGLVARVGRHLRQYKKMHWHIDYILAHADVTDVFMSGLPYNLECQWAKVIDQLAGSQSIAGLGASDCRCLSHLFWVNYTEVTTRLAPLAQQHIKCYT